jgi:hypothetical protein
VLKDLRNEARPRSGVRGSAILWGFLDQAHFIAAATTRQQISARFAAPDNDLNFRSAKIVGAVIPFTGGKGHEKPPSSAA